MLQIALHYQVKDIMVLPRKSGDDSWTKLSWAAGKSKVVLMMMALRFDKDISAEYNMIK